METLKNLINKVVSNLKLYSILGLVILLGLFCFKGCRKVQKKQDKDATSTVLTPDQKEKIVVDPEKHNIAVTTKNPDGTTTTTHTYLPDRPTQIIEDKNGKLKIVDHKFGTEVRPYIGVGGQSDGTGRIHAGADLFYFHKLDLGVGLGFNTGIFNEVSAFKDTRLSANVSYNVWSNTSLALSVDNHKAVGLFIKVRL
ncbi:MAG: hypothetical protein ACREBR_05735 [bacterium]